MAKKPASPAAEAAGTPAASSFARMLDSNLGKLQGWLDRVAEEHPDRAAALLLQLAEFSTPKMARTEVTGKDGGPVEFQPVLRVVLSGDSRGSDKD